MQAESAHIVLFGDYEQAIYSFIGSKLENLKAISTTCTVHNLQTNYRSPQYILDMLNDYAIELLKPAWQIQPVSNINKEPENDDLMIFNISKSDNEEILFIVKCLLPKYTLNAEGQTAILVDKNTTADRFAKTLENESIDFFKVSGYDLFDRKLIKDVMAFLGCLYNEWDKGGWVRLLHVFGKTESLWVSRCIVNDMFNLGLYPIDFLNENEFYKDIAEDFSNKITSKRIIIFDTETTGLDTINDDIIQIAAIEYIEGHPGRQINIYLYTEKSLEHSQKINKITKEVLQKKAVSRKQAFIKFLNFIGNDILVAHNYKFDREMLINNLIREGLDSDIIKYRDGFDTLELCYRVFPKLNFYSLEDLIDSLKLEGVNSHDALDDVKVVIKLIDKIFNKKDDLKAEKSKFVEANKKNLYAFSENFRNFWTEVNNSFGEIMTFSELIERYLSFLKVRLSCIVNESDLTYLNKLKRHMELKCGSRKLAELITEYFSDYRLYKEPDLLIGDEKVVISTIHKAKGLEFENVIIPQCVNGIYPNYHSNSTERKKEDARLFYVALSRAMKRIILTTHKSFTSVYGSSYSRQESSYLKSIEKYFKKNIIDD